MTSDPLGYRDKRLYLDLLKRSLCNYLYLGGERKFPEYDTVSREHYEDSKWKIPAWGIPHTLLRMPQLEALEKLALDVVKRRVPGDFIEAGVFRGGALALMRAVLKVAGVTDRRVWGADTFSGIPPARRHQDVPDEVQDWQDRWVADLDTVKSILRRYDLLDEQVILLKGEFADTLPGAGPERIALARLDADSYESTRDALEHLYPRVSAGGYVIIDDWHLAACKRAVEEYRAEHGITAPIAGVMGTREYPYEAFWQVGAS